MFGMDEGGQATASAGANAGADAGPSAPLRSAQDDRCSGLDGGGQATASAGANAGPSASLRFAQDDRCLGWMEEGGQRQVQVPMQVLRLRSG